MTSDIIINLFVCFNHNNKYVVKLNIWSEKGIYAKYVLLNNFCLAETFQLCTKNVYFIFSQHCATYPQYYAVTEQSVIYMQMQ